MTRVSEKQKRTPQDSGVPRAFAERVIIQTGGRGRKRGMVKNDGMTG
jgi:hypothetical protein